MAKLRVSDASKVVAVVKRAFFLAYNACGGTSGMGMLQARSNVTEDQVWKNVCTHGDYPGGVLNGMADASKGDAYGDYVFGRMMKLGIQFDPSAGTIEISDSAPRADYQGWSGRKYPSYKALVDAAAAEIEVTLSPVEASAPV